MSISGVLFPLVWNKKTMCETVTDVALVMHERYSADVGLYFKARWMVIYIYIRYRLPQSIDYIDNFGKKNVLQLLIFFRFEYANYALFNEICANLHTLLIQ